MLFRMTLLLVISLLLVACSPSPQDVVQQFIDAHNSGAVSEQVVLLNDDAILTLEGIWTLQGVTAIQDFAAYDSTLHARFDVRELAGDGNLVRCLAVETNDWLTVAGVDSITEIVCFELEAKKISNIRVVLTGPSQSRMDNATKEMVAWAAENRDDLLNKVMPDGIRLFTAEAAAGWLQLWNEYSQAK